MSRDSDYFVSFCIPGAHNSYWIQGGNSRYFPNEWLSHPLVFSSLGPHLVCLHPGTQHSAQHFDF